MSSSLKSRQISTKRLFLTWNHKSQFKDFVQIVYNQIIRKDIAEMNKHRIKIGKNFPN